jgi:hypothetical protein
VKQYQFKLSADFKRIIVRELPDFKERYLRDPKLDGPTGEKYTLRFSKEIVVSNAAEVNHRNSLLRQIGKRLREERRRLNATTDAEQRNRITYEIDRLQKMQTQLRQAPVAPVAMNHSEVRAAIHRAIKARRQAIRRELRRIPTPEKRTKLTAELKDLSHLETVMFRIKHRATNLPLDNRGRPYVAKTARGKRHVPVSALPLNERRKRQVPSAREIVEEAVFRNFADKGNIAMAYAKLAAINPEKYGEFAQERAKTDRSVQRALNRVGSDVLTGWPPTADELLVLENFYATAIFRRPLFGMAYDLAAGMLRQKSATMTVDRYRRILRKYFLA